MGFFIYFFAFIPTLISAAPSDLVPNKTANLTTPAPLLITWINFNPEMDN